MGVGNDPSQEGAFFSRAVSLIEGHYAEPITVKHFPAQSSAGQQSQVGTT